MKLNYKTLNKELNRIDYGFISWDELSPMMQAYIIRRYNKGILELLISKKGGLGKGYNAFLGVYNITKKGVDSAVQPYTKNWVATLKNNLIKV